MSSMSMDHVLQGARHGSSIRHSQAAIAGGMPGRTRDLPPGEAALGNLSGPLRQHLLPSGTLSARPDLCLWPAVGCGTPKRRIDRLSVRTRPPPAATFHRLGSLGGRALATGIAWA